MPKQTDKEILKNIDSFLAWYKSKMPDEVYLVKNKARYEAIFDSINMLKGYILKISPDAKFEVRHGDSDPTAIYFRVVTDETIFETEELRAALAVARNIEHYPLTNGKLSMAVLYESAYNAAPPYEEINK